MMMNYFQLISLASELPTKEKEEEEDEVEMADMRVHGNHQKRVL